MLIGTAVYNLTLQTQLKKWTQKNQFRVGDLSSMQFLQEWNY